MVRAASLGRAKERGGNGALRPLNGGEVGGAAAEVPALSNRTAPSDMADSLMEPAAFPVVDHHA